MKFLVALSLFGAVAASFPAYSQTRSPSLQPAGAQVSNLESISPFGRPTQQDIAIATEGCEASIKMSATTSPVIGGGSVVTQGSKVIYKIYVSGSGFKPCNTKMTDLIPAELDVLKCEVSVSNKLTGTSSTAKCGSGNAQKIEHNVVKLSLVTPYLFTVETKVKDDAKCEKIIKNTAQLTNGKLASAAVNLECKPTILLTQKTSNNFNIIQSLGVKLGSSPGYYDSFIHNSTIPHSVHVRVRATTGGFDLENMQATIQFGSFAKSSTTPAINLPGDKTFIFDIAANEISNLTNARFLAQLAFQRAKKSTSIDSDFMISVLVKSPNTSDLTVYNDIVLFQSGEMYIGGALVVPAKWSWVNADTFAGDDAIITLRNFGQFSVTGISRTSYGLSCVNKDGNFAKATPEPMSPVNLTPKETLTYKETLFFKFDPANPPVACDYKVSMGYSNQKFCTEAKKSPDCTVTMIDGFVQHQNPDLNGNGTPIDDGVENIILKKP